ncbi:MAG: lytic transglycosylase domain-containing protein [Bacillota bacterium]
MFIKFRELHIYLVLIFCLMVGVIGIVNYQQILRFFYPLYYQDLIFAYAAEYDLDPYLLAAIIKIESKFDRRATSHRGARGLMQIMPQTGQWIADRLGVEDFTEEDLYQAELNIKFGCWYLAHLKKIFDDDLILVIAAYNGGQGNVNQWLKSDEWSGKHQDSDQIPFNETKDYVEQVMQTYYRYQWLYNQ